MPASLSPLDDSKDDTHAETGHGQEGTAAATVPEAAHARGAAGATRQALLAGAALHFARHGYAGASIASIARPHGLTKQALLHHFSSKQALYGEVIEAAAARVLGWLFDVMEDDRLPHDQLCAFFETFAHESRIDPVPMQVLMRELLDGQHPAQGAGGRRAARGDNLGQLLESLVATVQASAEDDDAMDAAEGLAMTLRLLGAMQMFAVPQERLLRQFNASGLEAAGRRHAEGVRSFVLEVLRLRLP